MNPRWLVAVPIGMVLAFAIGRYTAQPPTVRDSRKVETSAKSTSVATAETHAAVAAKVDATKDVDTKSHTVIKWLPAVAAKDGCPAIPAHVEQVIDVETHAASKRTSESHSDKSSSGKVAQASELHLMDVQLHTSESRPTWSVTLLAGVQDGGKRLVDALPAPAVVGVVVQRRILGPVSAGLWATSGMAGGLSVRVDW